jgi:hypothetical protein
MYAWTNSGTTWFLTSERFKCWIVFSLESNILGTYFLDMSTAEKIFEKARGLPELAQDKLLRVAEELAREHLAVTSNSLTLREAAELRGKLAAWEEDWNAPGMEAYDRS